MTDTGAGKLEKFAVPGLLLLASAAFAASLGNGFALDDTLAAAVVEGRPNEPIATLHGPGYYFSSDYWRGFGLSSGLFRPVTIYSYAVVHAVFGANDAFAHHLLNVLLHCWGVILVWRFAQDLRLSGPGAWLVTALFAVHAIHSEVVATVTGRGELLAFCFGLAGLLLLRRRGPVRVLLAGIAFFLAFGSKESAVAWAVFTPLYFGVRGDLRGHHLRISAALLPGLVLFLALRENATAGVAMDVLYDANPLVAANVAERFFYGLGIWCYGGLLCAAPFSLQCLYGPGTESMTSLSWIAFPFLVAWLVASLLGPARSPGLFASAAIFFGFGFLTSNIPIVIGTVFAERLYYTASLGVCLLPGLLLPLLSEKHRRLAFLLSALWIAGNLVVDVRRSLVWKDNETLLLADSESDRSSATLQMTAAKFFHAQEHAQPERAEFFREKAQAALRRALAVDPQNIDAHLTEALMLDRSGKPKEALERLQAALELPHLKESGQEAAIRKHLGRLLITAAKQLQPGLQECLRALELAPDDEELRIRILDLGRTALPAATLRKVADEGLARNPSSVVLACQKADVLVRLPDVDDATRHEVLILLHDALAKVPPRALREFRYLVARMQCGDTFVALERFEEARRAYEMVLALPGAAEAIRAKARAKLDALRGR